MRCCSPGARRRARRCWRRRTRTLPDVLAYGPSATAELLAVIALFVVLDDGAAGAAGEVPAVALIDRARSRRHRMGRDMIT